MTEFLVPIVLVAFAVFGVVLSRRRVGKQAHVRLTFPRGVEVEQAVDSFRSLTGLLPPWWRRLFERPAVALEVRATADGIEHVVTAPAARSEQVLGALRAAIPALRTEPAEPAEGNPPSLARELHRAGAGALRTEASAAVSAGLLASLQPLARDEELTLQYVIAPTGANPLAGLIEFVRRGVVVERQSPARPAEPELAVAIRAGVSGAGAARARQLMARLLGAFHPAGTAEARLVRCPLPSRVVASRLRRMVRPDGGGSLLGADELAAVTGFPLESPQLPGLTLAGSRILPAAARIPRGGLVLGDAVADSGRPVAIALGEVRRGVHVVAPTGAGKSTVLLNLAAQVVAAGQGLVLIDSKGDLAADFLDRIPARRRSDVVVFDPADPMPSGFNLIGGSEEAELVVDSTVGQFRARYGAAGLGPRSEDVLRACLTTLSASPGYTLCEVGPLLTNAAFNQRLLEKIADPVLEGFWGWFGSLSEAARAEVIGPLSNKLRSFTLRRRLRAVIGQSGGLDFTRALAERQVVVVSLAKGLIGEDAASLLGSAMTARLWSAIQGRAALPAEQRRPVTVICDEFQDFAALPLSFGDAVAQSRGYNVGWVLAHQHLAQLDAPTRQAVLSNCRSRLVLQTTASDAGVFAREFRPHLEAADLQGLGAFEGYAAVSVGSAVAPPASVRTRRAPPPLGSAEAVRADSRARYGRSPEQVDAAIRARRRGSAPCRDWRHPEAAVIRLAVQIAWPRHWPLFKLSLELRFGSPTTVCPKGRRES